MDDFLDVLLSDCVETDTVIVCLVKLEVLLLRAFHVHTEVRVVVRLQVFVRIVLSCLGFRPRFDNREVDCLSASVLAEAAW